LVEHVAALVDEVLHATAEDARAEADGLIVTRTRGGGRTYRHPGFSTQQHTTRRETNR
jgi:hypothetical protein